ncbi:Mur ligase [Globomyces pollinis-pini]|nr:Mur ligase [Globomyces pollinis-pini]
MSNKEHTGILLGKTRILQILEQLGNPQEKFESIHVAGTNGKGSVCAFISATLKEANIKTGSYNSPHLLTERDSIRIDSNIVNKSIYEICRKRVEQADALLTTSATNFELTTATAFLCFAELEIEIAVIEVGLGGLDDATNVIPPPLVCVITKMGIDHTEYLGNTIQEISSHKAGIIKPLSGAVVLSSQSHPECISVFETTARLNDVPLHKVLPATLTNGSNDFLIVFKSGLHGSYQLENAATAAMALSLLPSKFLIVNDHIQQGFSKAFIAGRMENIDTQFGNILVDGAHNISGCQMLRDYVNKHLRPNGAVSWIVGFTKGKKFQEMLNELIIEGDIVYPVTFPSPPGMPWITCVSPSDISKVTKVVDCDSSILKGLEMVDREITPNVVVAGSLYLVAQLYREIGKFE